ncbi:MAG: O-antigen ligase family protein [Candidatus Baltobacteraceae bacterium]
MNLHPVVDQTVRHVPLDPITAIAYAILLTGVAVLSMRRPAWGIVILILLQPFAFYRDIGGTTITLPKIALIGVLVGCTFHPGAFRVLRERSAARLLVAGLLVVGATALSIAQAAFPHPAFRETLKALEYVLLFSVVYAAYRLDPDRRLIVSAVAGVVMLVSLMALSEEILGAPSGMWFNGHPIPRIAGPLEGPNQLAGYFDIALPLLLAFLIERKSRLLTLALFLAMFADVLTLSRGGLIGAVLGIAVVCIIYRRSFQHALLPVAGGVLAGIAIAGFWAAVAHSVGVFRVSSIDVFRLNSKAASLYAGGVGTRSELWRAAIALWRQHPILGIGAGNFELELQRVGLRGVRTHANSLYLQSLVEGGLPLLAATLYLVWTSIASFARDRLASPLIAGAFAAAIALAVHQVADFLTFFPKVGGWWWLVLALAAAELSAVKREQAG